MLLDPKRCRCKDCNRLMYESQFLIAPSPFDPKLTLYGCPHCKSDEGFTEVCDEYGCGKEATCGFPTKGGGYRRTCYDHSFFKHPELKGE